EKNAAFVQRLTDRVADSNRPFPTKYNEFVNDPLSTWIESHFGVQSDAEGRLIRVQPRSISGSNGAAIELSDLTAVPVDRSASAIENALQASYVCQGDPQTGRPPFAFRLHQFISRGDTVFSSLDSENAHLTLNAQQFVPGDRSRVL